MVMRTVFSFFCTKVRLCTQMAANPCHRNSSGPHELFPVSPFGARGLTVSGVLPPVLPVSSVEGGSGLGQTPGGIRNGWSSPASQGQALRGSGDRAGGRHAEGGFVAETSRPFLPELRETAVWPRAVACMVSARRSLHESPV